MDIHTIHPKVSETKLAPAAQGWAGVARMGGVGDNLIAASVCRPLKQLGYKVDVITQSPNHVVFENNPFIDKISMYKREDWPQDVGQWQKWFIMRAKEYQRFGHLSHSCEVLCAAFEVQSQFWWPEKFRRQIFNRNYLEAVHDILDVPHVFGPLFFPTEEERAKAQETRKVIGEGPIIGWALAGTRIDKIYPQSPQTIARLIRELGAQVVMMGAPTVTEFEMAKLTMNIVEMVNGSTKGLHHAASPSMEDQKWPIRRILTFAQSCDLYIGCDTGPSWSVAFEPVPKIILLSHANPENITKHWKNTVTLHADQSRVSCWPCHRLHENPSTCRANKWNNGAACISDIEVDTIVSEARKALRLREEKRDAG
jgi:ADP-heptose:LPS heptosyltransferase